MLVIGIKMSRRNLLIGTKGLMAFFTDMRNDSQCLQTLGHQTQRNRAYDGQFFSLLRLMDILLQ